MRTCLHHPASGPRTSHGCSSRRGCSWRAAIRSPDWTSCAAATSAAGDPIPPFLRVWGGDARGELLLATGEAGAARRLLGELAAAEQAPDAAVGLARLDLAAGDPEAAISRGGDLPPRRAAAVQPCAGVEARVMEAIARDEIRDEEGALAAIERALDLGEPRGFLSPFVRHAAGAPAAAQADSRGHRSPGLRRRHPRR